MIFNWFGTGETPQAGALGVPLSYDACITGMKMPIRALPFSA